MTTVKKMFLDWKGNFRFVAKNEKGLSVGFDAPSEYGGEDAALSPMETVLASLAACTSFDLVKILRKKRQKLSGYSVELEAQRRDEPPEIFTLIYMKYIIKGENISKEAVKRAIQLSYEKYCSVGAMLKPTVPITTSYEACPDHLLYGKLP